jgi:hypothetical protein
LMPKSRKSARADDRKIMNAIFYVLHVNGGRISDQWGGGTLGQLGHG